MTKPGDDPSTATERHLKRMRRLHAAQGILLLLVIGSLIYKALA